MIALPLLSRSDSTLSLFRNALSHFWLFVAPWTITRQVPPCTEFCRQEYWNGLPLSIPGNLPNPEIKPVSLASPAVAGDSLPLAKAGKPLFRNTLIFFFFCQAYFILFYFFNFILFLNFT